MDIFEAQPLKMSADVYQSVAEFYAGKSVFITGGSGYLGKVIIEKLLYSCPEIDKVYVLLRDKKDTSAEERLRTILDLPVFDRLRFERPQDLKKIVLLKGDVCFVNLNLNHNDLETVKEKVSIVIHSAASIKFNDPLKVALKANVEGTRNVLDLCHSIRNIQVFVHMSTAFSNANRRVIDEVVYLPAVTIDEVYKLVEQDNNNTEKILDGRPNTYTFTKALVEQLIVDYHKSIPAVIIRPSIVTPALNEPIGGWVDNWYGPTGILTCVGRGVCRAVYTSDDHILDLIPVDYVSNLTLVAAAKGSRPAEVKIYNSCTSSINPIRVRTLSTLYVKECVKHKFNALPYPDLIIYTKRYWVVKVVKTVSYLVAQFADLLLRLMMNKPRFTILINQVLMIQNTLEFFTSHSWDMKTDQTRALISRLSPEDAQVFCCHPKDIDWKAYMPVYFAGVKKFLLDRTKF